MADPELMDSQEQREIQVYLVWTDWQDRKVNQDGLPRSDKRETKEMPDTLGLLVWQGTMDHRVQQVFLAYRV